MGQNEQVMTEAVACAMRDLETLLERPVPAVAQHPKTGSALAHVNVEVRRPTDVTRAMPPRAPSRQEVTEWDDDRPIAWRDLSDEEYESKLAAYERALAAWSKTRGVHRLPSGPPEVSGTFAFEDGSYGNAVLTSRGWEWTALGRTR